MRRCRDATRYRRESPGREFYLSSRRKLTPYIAPVDIRRTARTCIPACPEESHRLASASLSWGKIGADTSIRVVRHRRRRRRLRHPRRPPPPRRQRPPPRSMGTSPTITPERSARINEIEKSGDIVSLDFMLNDAGTGSRKWLFFAREDLFARPRSRTRPA